MSFFELFLFEYRKELYPYLVYRISFQELPPYRKYLLICFIIISFIIFFYFNSFPYIHLIFLMFFLFFIILTKLFELNKRNRALFVKMIKDRHERDIEILKKCLEENGLKNKKGIEYMINMANRYTSRYSFQEILKMPIILPTIFTLFFLPKIQKIIEGIPDKVFFIILFSFIILVGLLYISYITITSLFIPTYEISKKLVEDLEYILAFEENL